MMNLELSVFDLVHGKAHSGIKSLALFLKSDAVFSDFF